MVGDAKLGEEKTIITKVCFYVFGLRFYLMRCAKITDSVNVRPTPPHVWPAITLLVNL